MKLNRETYQEFTDMLTSGKLVIQKKYIFIGTLYPRRVLRYPFFINGEELYVKTSQVKDKLLAFAKRNHYICE